MTEYKNNTKVNSQGYLILVRMGAELNFISVLWRLGRALLFSSFREGNL